MRDLRIPTPEKNKVVETRISGRDEYPLADWM
jgi:hypothetical protein